MPPSTVANRVQPVLERGDDAEVAAAAAQRPEQVRRSRRRWRATQLAVGGDDVGRQQVVAGQAVACAASQPMPPPSVSPAMPVVETTPAGGRQAERLRLAVELGPASRRPRRVRVRARRDRRGCPSSATGRSPGRRRRRAWPATLWPPPRTATSRSCSRAKRTAAIDVGGAGAAGDQRGPPVDHRVPDRAGGVVAVIARPEQLAAQTRPELLDSLLRQLGNRCHGLLRMPYRHSTARMRGSGSACHASVARADCYEQASSRRITRRSSPPSKPAIAAKSSSSKLPAILHSE